MPDQITEVVSQSWFSRVTSSLGGTLVGLVLTVLPFFGLSWNERRAIDVIRALNEGAGKVVSVVAESLNPGNEGALVHFSGRADSPDRVEDNAFGVAEQALKLRRTVETYQWEESRHQESKTKMGGGTETRTTYSYRKVWDEDLDDSRGFKDSAGHANPAEKLFPDYQDVANPVLVGAFALPDALVRDISEWAELPPPALDRLPADIRTRAKVAGEVLYFGKDPGQPAVGDTRVRFEVVRPLDLTVVAQQVGKTLEAFHGKSGAPVLLLKPGIHSAGEMFAMAKSENRMMTWILRLVCFLVMFLGLALIFQPLRVLADVVPLVGRLVGAGTGFVAFLLAAVLSSLTVAVAWVVVRPEVGLPLLLLAGGLLAWLLIRMKRANTPPPLPPRAGQ